MPISARELRECINKLKNGRDITKKDIPKIVSLCRARNVRFDLDLLQDYEEWFKTVADRLPEFGNYAYTVPVNGFFLRNFNLRVIKAVSKCLDKMSLLDRASQVEIANIPVKGWSWTSMSKPTRFLNLKLAGDLRSSDVYEKASGMVVFFDEDLEEKYGIPEYDLNGSCFGINAQTLYVTLYVQSILSVAYRKKMPIVRITTEDVIRQKKRDIVLVDPSDRKKLEHLLSFTPDEAFDQIFSRHPESRKISGENSREIFNETGMMMERYSFLKEKYETAEDDIWMETIR